jgi:peptidoglycan/LPS O-acetylase OafA/YrhL
MRIAVLDSLRGIAAGLVVFHHWWIFYPRTRLNMMDEIGHFISDLNYLAVLFFFCLSGFSIGIKYYEFNSVSEISSFFKKRFKRIAPIAYISMLISFILIEGDFSHYNLLGNVLFLQTPAGTNLWFSPFYGNGPLWSLSFEIWFYIFFPIIFTLIGLFTTKPSLLFALVVWPIAALSLVVNKWIPNPWTFFLTLFPVWAVGWLVAQASLKRLLINNLRICTTGGLGVVMLVVEHYFFPSATLYSWGSGLVISLFLFFVVLVTNSGFLPTNRLLRWYGAGSFSMYAFHYPILIKLHELDWSQAQSGLALIALFTFLPLFEKAVISLMSRW